jgi:prepilin-type N-terminal cleavage/methylation domain-containing protein
MVMKPVALRRFDKAFTLIELLVVIMLIGVMLAVLVPPFHRPGKVGTIICLSNLRQTGIGWIIWADEHQGRLPWQVSTNSGTLMELTTSGKASDHFVILSNYVQQPRVFWCPTDKARMTAKSFQTFEHTNLSYFAALITLTNDPQGILSGDRHLQLKGKAANPGRVAITNTDVVWWTRELHAQTSVGTGVLLFADSHAEVVKGKDLAAKLQRQQSSVSQLVIP